jgi:hypothetical protein
VFRRKKKRQPIRLPFVAIQLGPNLVEELRLVLAFAEEHSGPGHTRRVLHHPDEKLERITCLQCAGEPVVVHPGLATIEEDELEF